ncbi:xylulokinase [Roseateles violae]|uniref:Xylulose kinase n=1 Tax=Roseateles violae TaxID=3058042 RepID=A0ABT8E026_9BURK|nr:xylulokinase [Pelomonas sp. PFR6]MDN3923159.1 xylulokinase [Pelomonas sp. PFR6]
MITLGLDLGTSALKLALVRDGHEIIASASRPLTVQRPAPGHSEQDPADWWAAACAGLDELRVKAPAELAETAAIAISGQMHGATLIDAQGRTLRPCILWNDGRSQLECAEFEAAWPASREVSGNLAMPGFTAPKLLWVRKHEPEIFARIAKVLLPKAWLGWKLSGQFVEEMSDASGTLWLDVAKRRWSAEALAATGLNEAQMPRLVEGSAPAAELSAEHTARWGFKRPPLMAGGAGDNAAGAVGVGAVRPGDAFVSLGTSGVLWATTAGFAPNPARAVHAFCHALPDTWHQMGVLLNAASSLAWWAQVCGLPEAQLVAEAAALSHSSALFAPYLNGERTPHNNAALRGGFAQLAADTSRAGMTQAVLEGVAYALRDCQAALQDAGTTLQEASVLGGGARSAHWVQVLADVLAIPLHQVAESEHGGALGAARLALMATGAGLEVARPPQRLHTFEPRADAVRRHADLYARWQRLAPHARDLV